MRNILENKKMLPLGREDVGRGRGVGMGAECEPLQGWATWEGQVHPAQFRHLHCPSGIEQGILFPPGPQFCVQSWGCLTSCKWAPCLGGC